MCGLKSMPFRLKPVPFKAKTPRCLSHYPTLAKLGWGTQVKDQGSEEGASL